MKRWAITSSAVLIGVLLIAAPAVASFSGANGKLAFESNRDGNVEIYTMNPDGSAQTRITNAPAYADRTPAWSPNGQQIVIACFDATEFCLRNADGSGSGTFFGHWGDILHPSWSPDGTRITFDELVEFCDPPGDPTECWLSSEIAVIDVDGTGHDFLTTSSSGLPSVEPSWSPGGNTIAFNFFASELRTINPDTGSGTSLSVCCADPNWSPDGTKVAYTRDIGTTTTNDEVFVANADGSDETRLTNNAVNDSHPAWSPDGAKIAFTSTEGGDAEIYVMNADGSGRQALTDNSASDLQPDWQPLPLVGYPRPKSAELTTVPLVPAYSACTSPNRIHGPPLAFGSCAPPQRAATDLTLGTPDANGQPPQSSGVVRVRSLPGIPSAPADEADARIVLDLTDVRVAADLTDYTGQLEVRLGLRITDKLGGVSATVQDTTLSALAQCVETADPGIGGYCTLVTSVDALAPGTVVEGKRTVWELDAVRVYHGSTPFAVQGVFVP